MTCVGVIEADGGSVALFDRVLFDGMVGRGGRGPLAVPAVPFSCRRPEAGLSGNPRRGAAWEVEAGIVERMASADESRRDGRQSATRLD